MNISNIVISINDESKLGATLYSPPKLNGAIMLAPATGIRRKFYHQFALNLAENGWGVITYDNNGIGDSLKGKINESNISLQQWGELDMPNVLNVLKANFPETKYHLIGHSAGGQLVGLMYNCTSFSSMFNVACSSGSIPNMKFPFRWRAKFFMNWFIPLNNILFGYTNTQWLKMGEPLPKNVAQQWSDWCNASGYVKSAFGKTIHRHWYDLINFPSLWLHAIDDDIAVSENVDEMMRVYPNSPSKKLTLNPRDYDLIDIGHMGFFSKSNKKLWVLATDWLEKH
ncbi:MAG: alpha/beta hydrolase [Saprospiraceae bacterium]|nr:alpha/beta hydrolase [Saprospiraceae bacterium]MBP7699324.1 alpha/beta hydrolase [Saprospiraceae bacterium]